MTGMILNTSKNIILNYAIPPEIQRCLDSVVIHPLMIGEQGKLYNQDGERSTVMKDRNKIIK